MASILVTYGSETGQTAKVAARVGTVLTDRGHDVATVPVDHASDAILEEFDAVVVGSPVLERKHLPAVVDFVERNREALSNRPTAFFQLSLASAMPYRSAREGATDWIDALVERTGWQPDRVGRFAGAIAYTKYDPLTRAVFKLVAAVTTGDTDTSRDYEYTDWDEVETFAAEFAAVVDRRIDGSIERVPTAIVSDRARRVGEVGLLVAAAAVAYWLVTRRGELRPRHEGVAPRPGRSRDRSRSRSGTASSDDHPSSLEGATQTDFPIRALRHRMRRQPLASGRGRTAEGSTAEPESGDGLLRLALLALAIGAIAYLVHRRRSAESDLQLEEVRERAEGVLEGGREIPIGEPIGGAPESEDEGSAEADVEADADGDVDADADADEPPLGEEPSAEAVAERVEEDVQERPAEPGEMTIDEDVADEILDGEELEGGEAEEGEAAEEPSEGKADEATEEPDSDEDEDEGENEGEDEPAS